jgi:hypothetical protein
MRHNKFVSVLLVGAAAVGIAAATAGPAAAGTDGQQIAFYGGGGMNNGFARVYGNNQHGNYVTSPPVRLDSNGHGQLDHWWWVGNVLVQYTSWNGNTTGRYCYVPQDQSDSDWANC